MLWVGTAISIASSIIPMITKGVTAGKQEREAKDLLAKNKRPDYGTPASQQKSLEMARQISQAGLPGKGMMADQLRASTGGAVRAAKEVSQDPASKLAAITDIYGKEMEGMQDLEMSDLQMRLRGQSELMKALQQQARYEDKEFDINKMQPYEQAMAAASALTGASMQNRQSAFEDIGRLGDAFLSMDDDDDDEKKDERKEQRQQKKRAKKGY
jgi:hypothetical protein